MVQCKCLRPVPGALQYKTMLSCTWAQPIKVQELRKDLQGLHASATCAYLAVSLELELQELVSEFALVADVVPAVKVPWSH